MNNYLMTGSVAIFSFGLLTAVQLHAADYTTSTAAGTGSDWGTVGAGWSSGTGATAGSTYEALNGALVRSPRNSGPTVTFPGLSLQIDSGAAMRFKTGDVGGATTFVFNNGGLILNGGQAQAGDAINSVVSGSVHVLANSSLTTSGPSGVLDTPNHPAPDTRTFSFTANIDGTGLLTLMNGKTSIANPSSGGLPDFAFSGDNHLFSGGVLDLGGWFQVAGASSLGTGNLSIMGGNSANQAIFSTTSDLVSQGTLTLGSVGDALDSGLILDHSMTFSGVTIGGASLGAGSYNVSDLTSMGFGANIAGGSDTSGHIFLTVAPVPEPSPLALATLSGLGALILRRKRA